LEDLPYVKEFRQQGLMMALEFENQKLNFELIRQCLEKGVLTDWFLFCDTAMRISPPLTISEEEIETACELIKKR
jgi:acetylornithine/succinyldiaminopimelate/putrescine aminotransferase